MTAVFIAIIIYIGYTWFRQSWREAGNALSNLWRTVLVLALVLAVISGLAIL